MSKTQNALRLLERVQREYVRNYQNGMREVDRARPDNTPASKTPDTIHDWERRILDKKYSKRGL